MNHNYRAFLLCAGEGIRLKPITNKVPKCLVEIGGKPLLYYWLKLLNKGPRPKEILINTFHLPEKITDFVSEISRHIGIPITVIRETSLLGTAGSLIAHHEKVNDGSNLLLAHADNLTYFELSDLLAAHDQRPKLADITIMSFVTDSPRSCGIIETDDANILIGFVEKPSVPNGLLANAGVFLLGPTAIREIKLMNAKDFSAEIIPKYLQRALIWKNTDYHRDIGTPEALQKARNEFPTISKLQKI